MHVSQLQKSCDNQCLKSSIKNQSSVEVPENQSEEPSNSQQIFENKFSSESSLLSYKEIFSHVEGDHRSFSWLLFELKKHGVSYNQNYLAEHKKKSNFHEIRIISIQYTRNFQVVTLTASLGPFSQELKIYNTFSPSFLNPMHQIYSKKLTGIYCLSYNLKLLIVKGITFQKFQPNNFVKKKQFFDILREYFVGKMMSILEIGPKLCKQFGFDIFLSETNACFFLENCKKFKNKTFDEQDTLSLKKV